MEVEITNSKILLKLEKKNFSLIFAKVQATKNVLEVQDNAKPYRINAYGSLSFMVVVTERNWKETDSKF